MVVPFRKFSTKKEIILTSKIDQLIITIGINTIIEVQPHVKEQRTVSVLTSFLYSLLLMLFVVGKVVGILSTAALHK